MRAVGNGKIFKGKSGVVFFAYFFAVLLAVFSIFMFIANRSNLGGTLIGESPNKLTAEKIKLLSKEASSGNVNAAIRLEIHYEIYGNEKDTMYWAKIAADLGDEYMISVYDFYLKEQRMESGD